MDITEVSYRMFEIYAREYKKFINENEEIKIPHIESKMKEISDELTYYVKEICKLDVEFKQNSDEIPDPIKYFMENGKPLNPYDYINNTSWEGFWKQCSGKDLEYFISYLEYPIIYPKHENYLEGDRCLLKVFIKETGLSKIPYGVKCAQIINKKYFIK